MRNNYDISMNITNDVVNMANQMLNNIGGEDYGYPMLNMEDLPFLNIAEDIDNVEMKMDEPILNNEGLFDEIPSDPTLKVPNKKAKAKQV